MIVRQLVKTPLELEAGALKLLNDWFQQGIKRLGFQDGSLRIEKVRDDGGWAYYKATAESALTEEQFNNAKW